MGLRLEWIVRIEDLKNAGKENRVLQRGCSLTVEEFLSFLPDLSPTVPTPRTTLGVEGLAMPGDLFLLDY